MKSHYNNDLPIYQYPKGFKGGVIGYSETGGSVQYCYVCLKGRWGVEKLCVPSELQMIKERSFLQIVKQFALGWAKR